MQHGLAAALIVAVVCAVVGTFVVRRGLAFLGEAMRHALFVGVVISFLLLFATCCRLVSYTIKAHVNEERPHDTQRSAAVDRRARAAQNL